MNKQLQAMISLLEDPEKTVYEAVQQELMDVDPLLIPELETAWENADTLLQQDRLEKVISHLRFRKVANRIKNWNESELPSFLDGWIILSQIQYPDLEPKDVEIQIQQIVTDAWLEMNESLTSLEKTTILNHILFELYHFDLNVANFGAPQNCFINDILSSRKGNPSTLTLFYCLVARKLNLPIYHLNLKRVLFLGYYDPEMSKEAFGTTSSPILFYINPANKGAIIGHKEMDYYLSRQQIEMGSDIIMDDRFCLKGSSKVCRMPTGLQAMRRR
ncbi:transglutaminase family protein [Prolixibacter bellariivorans]|uniref:transglutaminase family protein n=1 Tax=Prolixibacter bellariivorans TaxID=314319 RepID=UPI000471B074|nr:transglutaminase family protein [Prolixibacter bellariivorans]